MIISVIFDDGDDEGAMTTMMMMWMSIFCVDVWQFIVYRLSVKKIDYEVIGMGINDA